MKTYPQILSSYNIARKCDVVFSEIVTHEQYDAISSKNECEIISFNKNFVFYKLKYMDLTDNDIIFLNTMTVDNLFFYLSKLSKIKNLKIITHQTDLAINEKLFRKKPECVSDWYSPNLKYEDKNLHPIPLGIANNYSNKNLTVKNFVNINKNIEKIEKLYVNFVENTNQTKRAGLFDYFNEKKWANCDEPNLSLDEYKQKILRHKFILCPPGNGIDTHRMWESLYLGSIPVVEKKIGYKKYSELPVIEYENIEDLNQNYLNQRYKELNLSNLDFLDIDYWINPLKEDKKDVKNNEIQTVVFNKYFDTYFIKKNRSIRKIESILKKYKFYLKKIIKLYKKWY